MATKTTITTITGDYGSKDLINANFVALADAIDLLVSRDGESPNTMLADLDMNSHKLINVTDPANNQDAATKIYVDDRIVLGAAYAAAAAASAAAALASEGAASGYASDADTARGLAVVAQNAAEDAQAAAELALDSFDDRYLGAKAADPALDNDGDPLLTGAMYFNTVLGQMKVYTGAVWSIVPQIVGIVSNADATAITIDINENVGIGGTPINKLYVNVGTGGGVTLESNSGVDIDFRFRENGANKFNLFYDASAGSMGLYGNVLGSTIQIWDSAGNVGIGATPNRKLTIGGSGDQYISRSVEDGSLIITGGAGVSGGYAAAGIIARGATASFNVAGLEFYANGTERARIDSSGNVGIGVAPATSRRLHIHRDSAAESFAHFTNTVTGTANTDGLDVGVGSSGEAYIWHRENYHMTFGTNNTERMRIDANGYVGIGITPSYPFHVSGNIADWVTRLRNVHSSAPYGLHIQFSGASPDNNTHQFLQCSDSTTTRLIIYSDGDVLNHDGTYGTISDGRLKQDIVSADSQWDDIKAIGKIGKKYRHIKDVETKGNEAKVMLGWVAQEVESISPGLVMHTFKDVEDAEGSVVGQEETLGIRSSILFTKNVMATAEALERIEALEAQRATLEAKVATLTVDINELRSKAP